MAAVLGKMLPSVDNLVTRLLYTEHGQIFVSALLGLGLASAFRRVCKDKKCRIMRAAPLDEVQGKVFRVGNKCVTYSPYPVPCKLPQTKETLVGAR
jgi:hypothetical protein